MAVADPAGSHPRRGRDREPFRSVPVTEDLVEALHQAADSMPLNWSGGPWEGAAEWLHRRADAFEEYLRTGRTSWDIEHEANQVDEG